MNSYNLGLAFYRKYYEDWDFKKDEAKSGLPGVEYPRNNGDTKGKEKMEQSYFALKSKPLKEQTIPDSSLYRYSDKSINKAIRLKTTYPGLLLGSGYAHGIGKQGEHKIGFYFDHTTGLPIIPGPSVKGTLRSMFPLRYAEKAKALKKKGKTKEAQEYEEQADNRRAYLIYLIKDQLELKTGEINPAWIDQLEMEIFDGIYHLTKDKKPEYLPPNFRDIFHDAILNGPEKKPFLGDDFITPHKNTSKDNIPDALKNPNPIQFLKVLPEKFFTFQFRLPEKYFILNPTTKELEEKKRILTSEQRCSLFQAILEDIGIGAKTNVGYGRLQKPGQKPKRAPVKPADLGQQAKKPSVGKQEKPPPKAIEPIKLEKIRRGAEVLGEVAENKGGKIVFKLDVIGYKEPVSVSYRAAHLFEVGAKYKLKIKQVQGKGPKRKLFIDSPSPNDKIN